MLTQSLHICSELRALVHENQAQDTSKTIESYPFLIDKACVPSVFHRQIHVSMWSANFLLILAALV